MKYYPSFLFVWIILTSTFLFSQTPSTYKQVKVFADHLGIHKMKRAGLPIDCGAHREGDAVVGVFSSNDMAALNRLGLRYEILNGNMTEYYVARNLEAQNDPSSQLRASNGCISLAKDRPVPAGFSLGSMGGYFTYQEMLNHLDTMAARYPNLISVRQPVDTFLSHEGRPLYWVRLSDNPNTDEAEAEVLYTGVHHAREPMSMSNLIYYLYYLLENYATDDRIKGLVDNTELYVVPCVNPDGYIYNETTNPGGGGLWRKNRRDNGDGTFGVDLNRNYGFEWGYDNIGSSPSTSSDTYRGPAPFSEPEVRAMKYFCESHQFRTSLNYHAFGNLLFIPWNYGTDLLPADSTLYYAYIDLLQRENLYLPGPGNQTLLYTLNGEANDWQYGEQTTKNKIMAFTPEIGDRSEGFWPPSTHIVDLCGENISQNLVTASLAGPYARVQGMNPEFVAAANEQFRFSIQRLGLEDGADYTVSLMPLSGVASVGASQTFSGMDTLETRLDSISYELDMNLAPGSAFRFLVTVDNGWYTTADTITQYFGYPVNAISDQGTTGNQWTGTEWGPSTQDFHSPPSSLADSPNGDYLLRADNEYKLIQPIDLTTMPTEARMTFWTRWEIEPAIDYAQVSVSDNSGFTWTPICGNYTRPGSSTQDAGKPVYHGIQGLWVKEEMSLNEYIGKQILVKFRMKDNLAGSAERDGIYVDDFSIDLLFDTPPVSIDKNPLAAGYQLGQSFPNPTDFKTAIRYKTGALPARLVFIDALGREVAAYPLASGEESTISIDTEGWASGMYHYFLETELGRSGVMRMAVR